MSANVARPWRAGALIAVGAVAAALVSAAPPVSTTAPAPVVPVVSEAPDAASAALAARRQGTRVEILSERSETSTTFANPDGGQTSELTVVPTRVRRGSGWVPVDTTLVRQAGGAVGPRAAAGDLTFSGGGADAPLARITKDGKALAVHWPTRLPAPRLSEKDATYPEVLPGVDLVMRAEPRGFQQLLVIRTPEAARNPALAEIGMRVATDGLRVTVEESGALRAIDEAGNPVFTAPPPTMWDSASRAVPVGVAVAGEALTLRPDRAFLADPATVFPVVVDPNWAGFSWATWGTVVSGNPTTPYPRTSPDPQGYAQVGRCWNGDGRCNGIGTARTYLQFDTSAALNGRTILKIKLYSTVAKSPNCDNQPNSVYLAFGPISDGTTWNTKPEGLHAGDGSIPGVSTFGTCGTNWKPFEFGLYRVNNTGGLSTYFLAGQREDIEAQWRKYHAPDFKLSVEHNLRPHTPYDLQMDPPLRAPCRWCDGKSYVADDFVRFIATMSDPDSDRLRPRWRTSENGVDRGNWLGSEQLSGATHSADNIDLRFKHGVEFRWWVHASDGVVDSDAGYGPGPFVADRDGVYAAPQVTSAAYPQDNAWHGGAGVRGQFTFSPGAACDAQNTHGVCDIDHYRYGWNEPLTDTTAVDASALGGPATVTLAPDRDGPRTLYVQSVDRAGHASPVTKHRICVRAGNGPLARWSFEGNANDTAFLGDRPGTLSGATSYGPGAVGSALQLSGSGETFMTARNTVRTDASFSVSAWVKLDRVDGGWYTAISQDGNAFGGFSLQYEGDHPDPEVSRRWVFLMPQSDVDSPAEWYFIRAPDRPVAGTWTHLAATYDAEARQMALYVNGSLVGTATRYAEWHAAGPLRVGALKVGGTVHHRWAGAIDEVQAYDRALSEAEVKAAVSRDNVHVGHWKLDEDQGTTAHNSVEGGQDAVLNGGFGYLEKGAVGRAIEFNGQDGYAATGGPAVRTDQSFTVAAWVNAKDFVTGGRSMTAVSQDGNTNSGFYLQYNSAIHKWVFLRFTTDNHQPEWIGIQAEVTPVKGEWVHLAGVYDAGTRQLRIYVDGQLGGQGTLPGTPWSATGPLTIGRAKVFGEHRDHWYGGVDEVRLYSRVLAEAEIRGIMRQGDVTVGEWKLDGNATDSSSLRRNGHVEGGPAWVAGQTTVPNPADLAILLDGRDDHIRGESAAVDTTKSFSVAAWVRPDKPGAWSAAVSQDGQSVSGFSINAGGDGRWHLFAAAADRPDPPGDWVVAGSVQYGAWTHLAGVYSKERQRIELYVNGVLIGSTPHTGAVNPAGPWQIGRVKWNGQHVNYFAGAIDDVKLYGRPLFAEEIVAMAGRDASLVHNWRFDEGAGTNAADSIGARGGTLTAGAGHGPGRVGNAVRLDGTTGAVSTAGVDLRTDQSFTVSAWVHLDHSGQCATVCKVDAVSLDGGPGNPIKFRLGHIKARGSAPDGKWLFEVPEQNGTITEAAVSVRTGQIGSWVFLVGVYDAPSKLITLYVIDSVGPDSDNGTVLMPWPAAGGLQVGRGIVNGKPVEHWSGSVDEVRLYTGAFDTDRINALYASYPVEAASADLPAPDAGYWKFDEGTGTTVKDSSGRGLTATVQGSMGWIGGRTGYAGWLDGAGHVETAGPVLDTSHGFSVAAWVFPRHDATGDQTVFGHDGTAGSAFRVKHDAASRRWTVVVPVENAAPVVLTSAEPADRGVWSHLAVVYDAEAPGVGLQQLRLYLNGALSAVRVGVSIPPATGRFAIGRGWAGAERLVGGVGDVRAFGRALATGQIRRIHDSAPAVLHGWHAFEGTAGDVSWRKNPTTVSGGHAFMDGVRGKGLWLNGVDGAATGEWITANMVDSFTVSAWARLSGKDHDATVLAQQGSRASGFVLQYNKNIDRWIFGAPTQDADDVPLVYAYSPRSADVGAWTHLTGVYDYPARQLRLYVNGELAGIRDNTYLWPAWGSHPVGTTIGRATVNGAPAGYFAGTIDEVVTDIGVVSEEVIRVRGTFPTPAGGQLGRLFNDATGDHYTVNSTGDHAGTFGPIPPGYRYEGPLGKLLPAQLPNTRKLYSCRFGTNMFTSIDDKCEGQTPIGALGWVYTQPQAGVATIPLYRCWSGTDHFESLMDNCENGGQKETVLGYTVAYSALVRYTYPIDGENIATVIGAPGGYRRVGTLGLLSMVAQPGTRSLFSCRDGVKEFVSLEEGCEGKTQHAWLGALWTQPHPSGSSIAIYDCRAANGVRWVSVRSDCEGHQVLRPLGHLLTAVPAVQGGE